MWIKHINYVFFIFKSNLNSNLKIHYSVHGNIQKKNQDNNKDDIMSVHNKNDNNFTNKFILKCVWRIHK